tara:strand:- start:89 stop:400 length:312 start_codon:yes stop_codon:yes gene_type:complete
MDTKTKFMRFTNKDENWVAMTEEAKLTFAQEFVGGYIEIVNLPDGDQMVVCEDAPYMDAPFNQPNQVATDYLNKARTNKSQKVVCNNKILGHALLLSEKACLT